MTEFERRAFLAWSAGFAFTVLTAGSSRAEILGSLAAGDGQDKKEKDKDKKEGGDKKNDGGGSKPKDGAKDNKDVKVGEQADGSYVLDPENPPKLAKQLDTKKQEPHGHYVEVGKDTVLVAQTNDKKWVAVSGICTHKACGVVYKADDKCFQCPCHGSKFSEAGKATKKPATTDLTAYDATEITVGKKKWVKIAAKK